MKGCQIKGLDKESLKRIYVDNLDATLESVALDLGCNRETVRRWMRRYGLPIRPRGGTGKPILKETKPLANKEWLKEQLKKYSHAQIAKSLGVSRGVVTFWVKKQGLWDDVSKARSFANKEVFKKDFPKGRNGKDHPNWKGGVRIADGYVYIYVPEHPAAFPGRPYVQQHRLVMEEKLGRYLESDEVVHHLDGNRMNNDIDNLEVKYRGQHLSDHFKASHEVTKLRQRVKELEAENQRFRKLTSD